jgi:hypothetical protein
VKAVGTCFLYTVPLGLDLYYFSGLNLRQRKLDCRYQWLKRLEAVISAEQYDYSNSALTDILLKGQALVGSYESLEVVRLG